MSVGQGYESTEERHDYKTSTGTTYGGKGQPMDIGRSNNNFKDRKPKYFNCNKYRYMAKDCQGKKKEQEMRKCFKCDKEGHIAKYCKGRQMIKNRKVKEDSDNKDDKKKKGFGDNLK